MDEETKKTEKTGTTLTERMGIRVSPEVRQALEDSGVVDRKETSALIDKLLKEYFEGIGGSSEIQNFRNLVKTDFAEMLKKYSDEVLYWQRLCYKKDCYISELISKEAERQSSIQFAIRKMNFDYGQALSRNTDADSIFAVAKKTRRRRNGDRRNSKSSQFNLFNNFSKRKVLPFS